MKTITVPPSKSIAHRAVICAALASGESRIRPIILSDDVEATCRCMAALGAEIRHESDPERPSSGTLIVQGIGKGFDAESPILDCGESGSTLRFLLSAALLQSETVTLTGSDRLMQRPLGPYLEALMENGALIEQGTDPDGKSTLTVKGPLKAGRFMLPGDVSSQYVTGLLLALPLLDRDSEIILSTPLESSAYVDLTISTMREFGVSVDCTEGGRFQIPGGQKYRPRAYTVEPDFSNAAFFLVAGALGYEAECLGLKKNSLQGDKEIIEILKTCGAEVTYTARGGIRVSPGRKRSLTIDARQIPDLVPILAVLLCFCEGESRIINAGRLRLKESDRLDAIASELNRLGAKITEGEDFLDIQGVEDLAGGKCSSHNDHRIAMALAVASIKCKKAVEIEGAACVSKSYPDFWKDFGETERVIKA